jgi:hypothetical protein
MQPISFAIAVPSPASFSSPGPTHRAKRHGKDGGVDAAASGKGGFRLEARFWTPRLTLISSFNPQWRWVETPICQGIIPYGHARRKSYKLFSAHRELARRASTASMHERSPPLCGRKT